MSQPPPLAYHTPQPPNPRPISVTVLAIIGIVLGVLGVVCTPFALLPLVLDLPQEPMQEALYANNLYVGWYYGSTVVGFLLSILLLAAAISALSLKPWARRGLIWYAWLAICLGAIGVVVALVTMLPLAQQQPADPAAAWGLWGGLIGGVCGGIIGLIYPVFVLIFMTRPHVVAAFEGESGYNDSPFAPPGS
jgi:hypothetical protein